MVNTVLFPGFIPFPDRVRVWYCGIGLNNHGIPMGDYCLLSGHLETPSGFMQKRKWFVRTIIHTVAP